MKVLNCRLTAGFNLKTHEMKEVKSEKKSRKVVTLL